MTNREFAQMDDCCRADISRDFRGAGCVNGAFLCCQRCGIRWVRIFGQWARWDYGTSRDEVTASAVLAAKVSALTRQRKREANR